MRPEFNYDCRPPPSTHMRVAEDSKSVSSLPIHPHLSVLIKFVELYLSWFSLFIYFNFWFRSFPFTNIRVTCQPRPGFWSSILQYLCPIKSISIQKFLMTSLRVICSLALLPNQKSWLRLYVPCQCFSKL